MPDFKEKTTKAYWDSVWEKKSSLNTFSPTDNSLSNYVANRFHSFFSNILHNKSGKSLLEIGCAASTWLPYFSQQFDLKISGLDRSVPGCEKAEKILEENKISGHIYNTDLFIPPKELIGTFDIIISFGVIEHFPNTAACLTACSRFLHPGGLMITIIPNLSGWMGKLQKHLDKEIFDLHVPLNCDDLRATHVKANLEVIFCDYFLFLNLGILNYSKLSKKLPFLWPVIWRLRALTDRFAWLTEGAFPSLCHANKKTSPYIICVSKTYINDKS